MIFSDKKVYTLLELVIVLIIVAILTRFGFAGFYKAREHTYLRQAKVELRLLKDAELAYILKRSTFTTCLNAVQCGNFLGLAFLDTANLGAGLGSPSAAWSYSVSGTTPYCAYAVRSGTGGYAGCTYQLCFDGANASTDPIYSSGSCP
jgi:type II secretory pathway pseudopilin PulG